MKGINLRQYIVFLILSFVLLSILPVKSLAEEEYVFERMWPVLEQPWYFNNPYGIAIDGQGNVYVADSSNDRIQKFNSSGTFITQWGSKGSGDGEFDRPRGIAIDVQGNVYVADTFNHRIQKFNSSGTFITKWGGNGSGDGQFDWPRGIAIDVQGNVYVADMSNDRIQKFSSDGTFITEWGSEGSGDGEFHFPRGIAIDVQGNVYVADYFNNRIQKFSSDGTFITEWGSEGSGDGEFDNPYGIAIDGQGNVYVADIWNNRIQKFSSSGTFISQWRSNGIGGFYPTDIAIDVQGNVYVPDIGNDRIQKFSSDGTFITKWGSEGSGDGEFADPYGIAIDGQGNVYVADTLNRRIQKFSSDGTFITKWGGNGSGEWIFNDPRGIAIDVQGNVYVTNTINDRIQKFSSSETFITKWGSEGSGDGEFDHPYGIAIDVQGNVYVADTFNHRIQKFNSSETFITEWGSAGSGDGEFVYPFGIAIDGQGYVYVADSANHRIQKFNSSGTFISKWGSEGGGDGEFVSPRGIAIDVQGNVYVADTFNHRIQKFSSDGVFLSKVGQFGSAPGLLNTPHSLAVSSGGKIYVSDSSNNRIQVFSPSTATTIRKAIIVAGSGPYATNTLWDATQMCASYAYRALRLQGYTADTIYYLSSDTDLDLDNDGYPDVDGDTTNANLEYAVKTWALDSDNLFIYMVGHGGEGTFVTSEFELLEASQLDAWLDTAQQAIPDFVAIVYDGCHSGSFVPYLAPSAGKTRIMLTSASSNEPAVFETDGGLSFGYQFFSYLFNGGSFYDSFVHGKKCVEGTYDYKQTPQVEGNGNGVGNEKADKEIAQSIKLGNETKTAGDIPRIESVSPAQTLAAGETSAFIHAQNVVDADGIQEVFAVLKPPNYSSGSSDNPVTDLPTINLAAVGNNSYSGMYNGFTVEGVYNVAVLARDGKGVLSLPYQTSVTVPTTTDCLTVGSDLSIQVPCAEYNGNPYGFTLDFYRNPDDMSGYYWKMIKSTLTTGTGSACIPIVSDLSMPMDCVSYNGTQYGFTMRFYENPYDPSGYYWKMDMSTLVVK
jgi:DNA-binding beta-propeller fold protein YncE